MISRLPIVVRSTEVDMLGPVNNAVYQQWLEWGRFEWVRDGAVEFPSVRTSGLSLVVVHVALDYRKEARMDDRLVIETALVRIGGRSLTYRQRVVHADGTVACDGNVVLACFDVNRRCSAELPQAVKDGLAPLVEPDPRYQAPPGPA